jgi:hypothetical protein
MATYKEIVYLCLDELKLTSDDSHFVEEHVLFLADKYRGLLIKQHYKDIRKEIPESNYQTICVDLKQVNAIDGAPCTGADYMKSLQEIPNMMRVGKQKISSLDYFQGNFAYTNNERFKYVGNNKYLKNQIYGTIAPDNHLYLKSSNPQMYYLEKVKVTGIFEDSSKAAELQCPDASGEKPCDVMDMEFPIEEALIPPMIELIVKELSGHAYQPADNENNATDDLDRLASYIARNMKERRV